MTEIEKNLAPLVDRINAEHRACEEAANSALVHAMNAGEMLTEAKAALPHGSFGPWLKENFAGSDRTARAYMRVYAHRGELEAKRQSSATLSLDGALKALSAPKEDAPPKEESGEPATFEDGVAAMDRFVEIRDSGAWRESGHKSFDEYLQARWGDRGVTREIVEAWENVSKDPPRSLRGAPMDRVIELCQRLEELEALPAQDPGLPAVGRALLEIEEKELYKLAGHKTFSQYCSERLSLSRRQRESLVLHAELAEVIPAFDTNEVFVDIPEDTEYEDFVKAWKILTEIEELAGQREE